LPSAVFCAKTALSQKRDNPEVIMQTVLNAITKPASKMAEAIAVLQHLASEASKLDEPCARILFQAADYLEDVLLCAPENAAECTPLETGHSVNDNTVWPVLLFDDVPSLVCS
jgi:hypothetical protein